MESGIESVGYVEAVVEVGSERGSERGEGGVTESCGVRERLSVFDFDVGFELALDTWQHENWE